jgi:hypothetical protein
MTTKSRSVREELLTTLPALELEKVVPLSEQTIRSALAAGQAEAEAARTTEQLPAPAHTLRFQ